MQVYVYIKNIIKRAPLCKNGLITLIFKIFRAAISFLQFISLRGGGTPTQNDISLAVLQWSMSDKDEFSGPETDIRCYI